LLTSAYLRRAATSADPAKAEADYLSAVRAGEGLIKLRTDAEAVTLFGQALIGSKQYARAAAALERATATPEATGVTFYLLGVAQSRATNFPKAIAALETAAKKSPETSISIANWVMRLKCRSCMRKHSPLTSAVLRSLRMIRI
jgi:tetratricopeptide (TPR) repeat protein